MLLKLIAFLRETFARLHKLANAHEHLKLLTRSRRHLQFSIHSSELSFILVASLRLEGYYHLRIIHLLVAITVAKISNKLYAQYLLTIVATAVIRFFVVLRCRKQYGQC